MTNAPTAPPGSPSWTRRRWLGLTGALAAAAAMPSIFWHPRPADLVVPLPVPNGYDDLLAAGSLIEGNLPLVGEGAFQFPKDPTSATIEELHAWLDPNRAALERLRVGLTRDARVPVTKELIPPARTDALSTMRNLCRLLQGEAEIAQREGRISDAIHSHLDMLRLARQSMRGGLILDQLVATAIESVALKGLFTLVPKLPPAEARPLCEPLAAFERDREPIAPLIERDRVFTWNRMTWRERFDHVRSLQANRQHEQAVARMSDVSESRALALLRILQTAVAVRVFQLEHPDRPLPSQVDAFVPDYLAAVPVDPFCGQPIQVASGETPGAVRLSTPGLQGEASAGMPALRGPYELILP